MTRLWFLLQVSISTVFLGVTAFAQGGCNLDVHSGLVHCVNEGQDTEVDDDTCADPEPGYLCVQGYGECTDGTKYHTANAEYSPSCGPPLCCNGQITCGYRQVCGNVTGGSCACQYASPIIVDTEGHGFHLTNVENGAMFDIMGSGHPIKMAWTAAQSGNAFLALDRNGNGHIDSGLELFGNVTAQPQSNQPNGYLALAEFDKPENGGNSDGIIDKRDAVFSKLLLWIDENHDGISQPSELHSLPALGVFSINLRYRDDKNFFDQFGNWFHYQAALNPDPRDGSSKDGRVTYDVYFDVAQTGFAGTALQSRVLKMRRWDASLVETLFDPRLYGQRTACVSLPPSGLSGGTR